MTTSFACSRSFDVIQPVILIVLRFEPALYVGSRVCTAATSLQDDSPFLRFLD